MNQNSELLYKKGYALLKLFKKDLAIEYFKIALEKYKSNYKALFGLGEAYYFMDDKNWLIDILNKYNVNNIVAHNLSFDVKFLPQEIKNKIKNQ